MQKHNKKRKKYIYTFNSTKCKMYNSLQGFTIREKPVCMLDDGLYDGDHVERRGGGHLCQGPDHKTTHKMENEEAIRKYKVFPNI